MTKFPTSRLTRFIFIISLLRGQIYVSALTFKCSELQGTFPSEQVGLAQSMVNDSVVISKCANYKLMNIFHHCSDDQYEYNCKPFYWEVTLTVGLSIIIAIILIFLLVVLIICCITSIVRFIMDHISSRNILKS